MIQLHSFWNLIQTTDEDVQKELFVMLQHKYSKPHIKATPSFLQMEGILKGHGNADSDRKMLDEYLQEKYGV